MSLENSRDLLLNISDADMKLEEIHSYRFKSFTLKPVERQLFDRDQLVSLTPKAFDILTFLIANAGHLVTKEELMETIWADSFVEEANLARLVHTIRKTLGEDENGNKFIETVPTKGYRFAAEVEKVIVTARENKESFATDSSEEFWPDRLESAASIDTHPVPAPMGNKKSASRWLFAGLAIVVVIGLVAAFAVWRNNTGSTAAKKQPIPSIAVLPFRPISTGERNLDFDLALANSVITYLNQSKSLNVLSFASMRSYTDVTQDAIAIGNERGTDYVLDSTYLAVGGHLQVTMNLVNVKTASVVWTHEYKGDDTGIWAAGPNVAAKIVPLLLTNLNLAAVDRGTENEEAWRSYIQGMMLVNKRSVEGGEQALEVFDNAIRLDPKYARAYMGRAHAIQTKLTNGGARDELCGPAREAEEKALELDPTLGDAMVFLATNQMLCTWDIEEGHKYYQRALETSPDSANVRRFYAVNIVNEKRFDEALEHLETAVKLDPGNTFNERLIGRALFFARRWDDAIEQSIKVKDMELVGEPEQTSFVYMSYEMKGDLENAFKWFLIVKDLEHESEAELNAWRTTYAESGWPGVLRRRLERALEDEKTVDDVNKSARLLEEITTLSVQLGDYDRAFEYMNKAVDRYVLFSGQVPVNPYLDPVRSDPRYKAIMARTWNSHGGNWQ